MNKKVLKTMIALVVTFLLGFYVLKIFFPEQFMMSIQNENFIKVGNFIDNNIILKRIFSGITTFIGTYLFSCAVSKRWFLPPKETLILIISVVGTRFLYFYDTNLATGIMSLMMFVIPAMLKADLRITTFAYTIHSLSQLFSLKIRNLPMYFISVNSVTSIFMIGECYLWLLLFYLYFNYKNKKGV